jgi:hypothetical protein
MMDRKTIKFFALFFATTFVFGAGAALGVLLVGPIALEQGYEMIRIIRTITDGTATTHDVVGFVTPIVGTLVGFWFVIIAARYTRRGE